MNHLVQLANKSWAIPHSMKDDFTTASEQSHTYFKDFLDSTNVFKENPINEVYEFATGVWRGFAEQEKMENSYIISKEFSVAKALLVLSYYEIMDGPGLHDMFTGFFRAGKTIMSMWHFVPFVYYAQVDVNNMIDFGGHILDHLSYDNAIVKFGQLQIEYTDVKQLWIESKFEEAGRKAADGLISFAEYEIPSRRRGFENYWPLGLLQPYWEDPAE